MKLWLQRNGTFKTARRSDLRHVDIECRYTYILSRFSGVTPRLESYLCVHYSESEGFVTIGNAKLQYSD